MFQRMSSTRVKVTRVNTLVTANLKRATKWIDDTVYRHHMRESFVIGIDLKFHHRSPAVLTINVGSHCLVFQLPWARRISGVLRSLLSNPSNKFVGLGVEKYDRHLRQAYGLHIRNMVAVKSRKNLQLHHLAEELGILNATRIGVMWNCRKLTNKQVKLCTLHNLICLKIGMRSQIRPWWRIKKRRNVERETKMRGRWKRKKRKIQKLEKLKIMKWILNSHVDG